MLSTVYICTQTNHPYNGPDCQAAQNANAHCNCQALQLAMHVFHAHGVLDSQCSARFVMLLLLLHHHACRQAAQLGPKGQVV
jgi:hypothetical protein